MAIQNLTDYLKSVIETDNLGQLDSFLDSGANEMPGIFLSIINDDWMDVPNGSPLWEKDDSEDLDDADDSDESADETDNVVRPALEVVFQERQTVIVGNPGSGKTTMVQFIMHILAERFLANSGTGDFLLYIPLRELTQSDTISSRIKEFLGNERIRDLFGRGRVFLFLDGLNEIQPGLYEKAVMDIGQFMKDYPSCGLVVTSRLYGYAGRLNLPVFVLHGFTDENIRDYIVKRTGNVMLYDLLIENDSLHELVNNPLLLNMLVSIWQSYGSMPHIRFHLYEQFIDYQFQKSGITSVDDRQTVADSLSRLAFSMRRYGYLSDSYFGMSSIVSGWIEPENVGKVTRMLLDCGLLTVSCKGDNFWCFSFMHETFQEYFSALYILGEYYTDGSLCVNLSLPEWRETLMLLVESLSLKGDTERLADFLGKVGAEFSKGGQTPFFNDRLDEMFRILSGCSARCTLLRDWMAQYLLFNMNNFLNLPYDLRTLARFSVVVSSAVSLGSTDLNAIFFRSFRWLQYWLYDVERVDRIGDLILTGPIEVMHKYLKFFNEKEQIYNWLQQFAREYGCFETIVKRVDYLMTYLFSFMDSSECRNLYLQNGDLTALLRSKDREFIDRQTEGKHDLHFPGMAKLMRPMDADMVFFIYDKLAGRMCVENRDDLFGLAVLPNALVSAPGLDERLLSEPVFAPYRERILKACYMVPAQFLSRYYFKLIGELREQVLQNKYVSAARVWYRSPSGLGYMDLTGFSSEREKVFSVERLKEKYPEIRLRKMQLVRFRITGQQNGFAINGDVPVFEVNYEIGEEVIPVHDGNELVILCARKTKAVKRKGDKACVRTGGVTHSLEMVSKSTIPLFVTYARVEDALCLFPELDRSKLFYLDNYYLFRPETVHEWQLQVANDLSFQEKAKLGILGMTLRPDDCLPKRLAVVSGMDSMHNVRVQFRDSGAICRYPPRFVIPEPGDIVFMYKGSIFKVTDWKMVEDIAMKEGVVTSRKGYNLFIQVADNVYGKDYYYYDETERFRVGDRVRFFPVLNSDSRFNGKPMACLMRKIG